MGKETGMSSVIYGDVQMNQGAHEIDGEYFNKQQMTGVVTQGLSMTSRENKSISVCFRVSHSWCLDALKAC